HINGLPRLEGERLLQFLIDHCNKPEWTCRFRWTPHSIAFWDNRCTHHKAVWDYWPNVRSGYRVQVEGTEPPVAGCRKATAKLMSLKTAFIAASIAFLAGPVQAQTPAPAPFPSKPLRFIVPFPPGGTLDVLARTVSNELGPALGQSIVVENRPGASGVIGAEVVARAPADGHTLVIVSNTLVTLPALRSDLPFDIFKDFAPVIELGGTPTVITVHPSFPARDLKEFIEAVRKASGGVSYNSPGIGSPPHIAGELLARAVGIPLVHVSYRGTQPAVSDLVAGHVPVMMAPLNAVLPFIAERRLYPIALTD